MSSFQWPSLTSPISVPTVPNAGSLPVTGTYDGQLYITTDTDSLYAWNAGSSAWVLLNSSSTVTGTGANGKLTVWTGTSALGTSSGSGVALLTSGALSTVARGNLTETTSDVLTISGGTNAILGSGLTIEIKKASASQNGYLSSSDWSVFNGKQAAGNYLTYTPNQFGIVLSGSAYTTSVLAPDASASKVLVSGGASANPSWALIVDANVSSSAAISYSKLALSNSIVNADIGSSAAIAYSKLALTGSILNADVSGSAAIAYSKLAALTSAHILVGNGSNVATDVAVSGDISLTNAGVTAIGTNKVTNAQLAQMATNTIKGNNTGGTANAADLTVTQTKALLNSVPTLQSFLSTGTQTGWLFTVTSANATVGATYTNNSNTYTVLGTIASGTLLFCSGTGATSGGTLTKSGGSGDASITFSSKVALATYTTPANALYLKIRMLGGGGGGGGGGPPGATNGAAGLSSYFGSNILSANGGSGGTAAVSGNGGAGGSASVGSAIGIALTGGSGGGGSISGTAGVGSAAGSGAASPFGGGGGGGTEGTIGGQAAPANTGSGGGGGGAVATDSAAGGGASGYVDAIITSPAGTYPYVVGTGGAAGAHSGAAAGDGGAGAAGIIVVEEFYQ